MRAILKSVSRTVATWLAVKSTIHWKISSCLLIARWKIPFLYANENFVHQRIRNEMMADNGSSLHEEYLNAWNHPNRASIAIRKRICHWRILNSLSHEGALRCSVCNCDLCTYYNLSVAQIAQQNRKLFMKLIEVKIVIILKRHIYKQNLKRDQAPNSDQSFYSWFQTVLHRINYVSV